MLSWALRPHPVLRAEACSAGAQVSAFCIAKPAPHHLVRFCFCKQDAKLQEAVRRLRAYLGKQQQQPLSNGRGSSHA